MLRLNFLLTFLISCCFSFAQTLYTIAYLDSTKAVVNISIQPATSIKSPVCFIMPRSIPGAYSITPYDNFIENIFVINTKGEKRIMTKEGNNSPRWNYIDSGSTISRIEYEVNLDQLERKTSPADASITRPGFAGILNYTVFGWINGLENQPVQCNIETFEHWPIFSTNEPTAILKSGALKFNTINYYNLADGQIFLGYRFKVKEFKSLVPLYIVAYSETTEEYLDDYGFQGTYSLGILNDYFGEIPFKHYSIMLRKAIPLENGNYPSLGMEHLQSATFLGDSSGIRRMAMSKADVIRTMPTFLHHMAHSYIPLRCYGDTYRPYVLEIPPIIKNIWFNEGFMWFLPYDTLHLEKLRINFINSVYNTAEAIQKMGLQELSQIASTMYSADFRLGKSVYSRGTLMAIEMNKYLKEKTNGKKSMKDIMRYLYEWSEINKRPFTLEELPLLMNKACEIDLTRIYEKWQLPVM